MGLGTTLERDSYLEDSSDDKEQNLNAQPAPHCCSRTLSPFQETLEGLSHRARDSPLVLDDLSKVDEVRFDGKRALESTEEND